MSNLFPWNQGKFDGLIAKQLQGLSDADLNKAESIAVPIAVKLLEERGKSRHIITYNQPAAQVLLLQCYVVFGAVTVSDAICNKATNTERAGHTRGGGLGVHVCYPPGRGLWKVSHSCFDLKHILLPFFSLCRTGDESTRWARFKPAPAGTAFAYQFAPRQVGLNEFDCHSGGQSITGSCVSLTLTVCKPWPAYTPPRHITNA